MLRYATVSLFGAMASACAVPLDTAHDIAADDVSDDDTPRDFVPVATGLTTGDDGDLGPVADAGCSGRTIFSMSGHIVDDDGVNVGGARVQMCTHSVDGTFACLRPTAADDNGVVNIEFPERTRCLERVVARVLVDTEHATLTCGVSLLGSDTTLTFAAPIVVPRTIRGADQQGEVTLSGGLTLSIDDDVAAGIDLSALGAVVHQSSCVAAAAPVGTTRLWALSPEGGLDAPGLPARLVGTGLSAGTRVSAHVLGGLDCRLPDGSDVERGAFAPFTTGLVVDEAGGVDLGAIPCLTWLALAVD